MAVHPTRNWKRPRKSCQSTNEELTPSTRSCKIRNTNWGHAQQRPGRRGCQRHCRLLILGADQCGCRRMTPAACRRDCSYYTRGYGRLVRVCDGQSMSPSLEPDDTESIDCSASNTAMCGPLTATVCAARSPVSDAPDTHRSTAPVIKLPWNRTNSSQSPRNKGARDFANAICGRPYVNRLVVLEQRRRLQPRTGPSPASSSFPSRNPRENSSTTFLVTTMGHSPIAQTIGRYPAPEPQLTDFEVDHVSEDWAADSCYCTPPAGAAGDRPDT